MSKARDVEYLVHVVNCFCTAIPKLEIGDNKDIWENFEDVVVDDTADKWTVIVISILDNKKNQN